MYNILYTTAIIQELLFRNSISLPSTDINGALHSWPIGLWEGESVTMIYISK